MCGVRDSGVCSPECDVIIMPLPLRLRAGGVVQMWKRGRKNVRRQDCR